MEFFQHIFTLIWRLIQRPFNLYGYSISYGNIIMLILAAGLVAIIFGSIFKD